MCQGQNIQNTRAVMIPIPVIVADKKNEADTKNEGDHL